MTRPTPVPRPASAPRPEPGTRSTRTPFLTGLVRRRSPLLALLILMPGIQGCGLGWLYMRVADSQRIRAQKLLTADNDRHRFRHAQKLYKNALHNYSESLLYDEVGNPGVYHKYGFTYLLLDPPDLHGARNRFQKGIKVFGDLWTRWALKNDKKVDGKDTGAYDGAMTKRIQRIAAQTAEEQYVDALMGIDEPVPDDNFAQTLSGLGLVYFLQGIRDRISVLENEDKTFLLATKYLEAADRFAEHRKASAQEGLFDRVRDYFDLNEIIAPTPHSILLARVYLYQARELVGRGHPPLAKNKVQNAKDALERMRIYYEDDPRFHTEFARLHLLNYRISGSADDLNKALKSLEEIDTSASGYWDARTTDLIRGDVYLLLKKQKEALPVIRDLRDRDSTDPDSILLQARLHALENEYAKVEDDLQILFTDEARADDIRFLLATGKIYLDMGVNEKAKEYFLKASYVDPKDIEVNYYLGQAYKALGDEKNMTICFNRVLAIDSASRYAREVAPMLNN